MFLLLGMFLSISLFGQLFEQKKEMYDYKNYIWQPNDRYNPTVSGIFSFFIPGLGQIASGETGRGIGIFLSYTALSAVFYSTLISYNKNIGVGPSAYERKNERNGFKQNNRKNIIIMTGLTATGIWISSIIDASNCAKINNLYFRDKYKVSINPNIDFLSDDIGYGLSLKFNF